MALFNSLKQCRSSALLQSAVIMTKQRSMTSSSTLKFATAASGTASADGFHHQQHTRSGVMGRLPAYGQMWIVLGIMGGMVGVAGVLGSHTAKQQLFNSPSVQVSKKKRRSFPEVDYPDAVLSSSVKFINKSFLRKVAHIQDNNYQTRPNPFTRSLDIETLKSAGVRT